VTTVPKIKRVDPRFLQLSAEEVKIGEVAILLGELRRVANALEERMGLVTNEYSGFN
jgi:hypothetical protein